MIPARRRASIRWNTERYLRCFRRIAEAELPRVIAPVSPAAAIQAGGSSVVPTGNLPVTRPCAGEYP